MVTNKEQFWGTTRITYKKQSGSKFLNFLRSVKGLHGKLKINTIFYYSMIYGKERSICSGYTGYN